MNGSSLNYKRTRSEMKKLSIRISDEKYASGTEIERTYKEFARSFVPSDRVLKILDIGCGTGVNASKLGEKGHQIIGIDISPVAIEKFRLQGFEGKVCDLTKGIPYGDDCFDLVFASDIIEHLEDTDVFLTEILRVLKPHGNLILSTINSAFWVFRIFALLGYTVSEVQHPGHIRFFSKRGLTIYATQAGFRSVRVAGRNMYFIISGNRWSALKTALKKLGFKSEIRFRTKIPFWHLSRLSIKASSFWSDALILTARK